MDTNSKRAAVLSLKVERKGSIFSSNKLWLNIEKNTEKINTFFEASQHDLLRKHANLGKQC